MLFLEKWGGLNDKYMIFSRNIKMGMAFSGWDPVFANACYEVARRQIRDSIGTGESWSLLHLVRLVFRLNASDANEWFRRATEAQIKEGNDAASALQYIPPMAAQGDGVRADTAMMLLNGTLDTQPMEAKRLIEGWVVDGTLTLKDNAYGSGYYSDLFLRLAKNLAPLDPEGAGWVAARTPEYMRWRAQLYAASGILDPAARRKAYLAAVGGERESERLSRYDLCLELARRTSDTSLATEMRGKMIHDLSDTSRMFDGNVVSLVYQLGDILPDACRMRLEMEIWHVRELNPERADQLWLITSPLRAMAWLDPDRAVEIAESLGNPKSVAQGKYEIIRSLLTPSDRWRSLYPY